jgi:hypothetical protein
MGFGAKDLFDEEELLLLIILGWMGKLSILYSSVEEMEPSSWEDISPSSDMRRMVRNNKNYQE